MCETKPIPRIADWGRGLRGRARGLLRKRTQFPARAAMGPRHGLHSTRGRTCENEPNLGAPTGISSDSASVRWPIVRNEANCRRDRRKGKYRAEKSYGELYKQTAAAKQSQFPAGPGGTGAGGTWDESQGVLYKQTQFLPAMPIRRSAFPGGTIVRNKPNLPGCARRPSPAPRPSGLAPGPRGDCAKRSQFPPAVPRDGRSRNSFCPGRPAGVIILSVRK